MVPTRGGDYPRRVPDVLIASDEDWVREDVRSVLSGRADVTVREVSSGPAVVAAVRTSAPALAVLDLQMGNMGGMATCLELRLEESAGVLPHVPVLMLLDRRADVFLARRSEAEGFLVKPLDPIRLRRAIDAVLAGGSYEDRAYQPVSVPASSSSE
jgi:DNA-binding NarL/FixJ family response regulator